MIVLFLRYFGNNQFEIPVYYETTIPVNDCDAEYRSPFFLSQTSILSEWTAQGKITLIGLIDSNDLKTKIEFVEEILRRNNNEIDFDFVLLSENEFKSDIITFVQKSRDSLTNIGNCELLVTEVKEIKDPMNFIVLTDKVGRVRGYYQIGDLDELDRLLVEVDILNSNE